MGFFGGELSNVVEWQEYRDDVLFWKWQNNEIKKGSKLVIRSGQAAIFMFDGRVEGIFNEAGSFDIESNIIPFLSTLKGFKFGFNSGMRAEVLFINTKELSVKWGTKNAVMLPAPGLPGGMPIRAFGTFNCKISDHAILIEKIAGIKQMFTIDDVKERVIAMLDQLLMKWIAKEGKDMFNLQVNATEIAGGLQSDLDMEMLKIGIGITMFNISSFSYPEEIQKMAEKAAAQSMIGDVNKYSQISMADSMANGGAAGTMAGSMAGMQMGAMMGAMMANNMAGGMQQQGGMGMQQGGMQQGGMGMQQGGMQQGGAPQGGGAIPNFCPNCGSKTTGANFCPNCGQKLV